METAAILKMLKFLYI